MKSGTANDLGFERPKRPKKLRQKHNWGYQLGEQDQLALGIDKPLIFSRSFFGLFGLSKPKSFAVLPFCRSALLPFRPSAVPPFCRSAVENPELSQESLGELNHAFVIL
jgi:hypothetical protein